MVAGLENVGLRSCQAGTDGNPTAEALGQRHDVGRDAVVLVCEPAPGPAEPCLDLVEDQQEVLLVTPATDAFQVAASCGDDPDLAHDRLEHHRHRLVGGG